MSKKILLIEDEKQLARNISIMLEAEDFIVKIAYNGLEGVDLAIQFKPDLIICDIMMPKMNGYDVISELHKNKETSIIPFIFLTAKVGRDDFRRGMELGADDYIFKPFTSEELVKAIYTRLSKFETVKAIIIDEKGDSLVEQVETKYKPDDSVMFKMHNSSLMVKIEKMKYITTANQYSNIILDNNKHILVRRQINTWEQTLPENMFIRIHRSTIINMEYLINIEKSTTYSYCVTLKDTSKLFNISRSYYKKIKSVR